MDDTISQKYCRVCTNKKTHMMSIFEHYDFFLCNLQVCEVITKCASVQIRKLDGFPEQICSECLEHLRQAFSFKQLCEDSDYEFRHNLVTDRIVSEDAYCEEVTKIECCDDNDNIFNEELHSASCDDGFEIRNEFCEGETNIQYGILGNRLDEQNVTTSTTDSTLQNLDEDVSEVSNTCCTKVKEEINGNNVEQLEIKLDCYEEDTKVVFGDLAMLHEENPKNSSTTTLQTLNEECSSRDNSEEIIENGDSDKHLQEGDIGKSSTDSTTLEDVHKELSAKTTPIERPQISEINLNLDQVSEDTEISSNELRNEVNTNISKDVGSATKSDFTERTEHCGISNKQLLQEGNVTKSSTDLNRSHNLNDALGERTPTIIHNENSHICKFFRLCLNENEVSDKHLQEGDIGKSSTDSITLEDVNKDLSAKTTTIERSQICEITVNLDQISEDTEISSNVLCNEVNTNISKDVGSATKSDFTKRTKHCGILNKQLLQEGTIKKSSTDLNRSHNLNDALGPTIIHNENSHICKFFRLCLNETETLNNHGKIYKEKGCYKCKICGKYYTCKAAIIRLGIPIRTGCKPYKREICNTSSNRTASLNRHVTIHPKKKPYKCKICDKNFRSKRGLVHHIRIHTGEKPYKCETCSRCFSQKVTLNRHMRIHTGEKSHKCEICSKCFSQKVHLNQHMTIHTGEKPHKCETCNECFGRKHYLNQHMRVHTGEKPHKCETCSECFSRKDLLNRHMMIHTGEKPHKCETCSECFSRTDTLNQHMRIHTGEKLHKCKTCSECFVQKVDLNKHMRIHAGEKHKCEICGKCFSQNGNLKRHMTIHTGATQ